MVTNFSKTFISQIQRKCQQYLKNWLAMPQCSDSTILYTGKVSHGLKVKNIIIESKKLQVCRSLLMKSSSDGKIQQLRKNEKQKETCSTGTHTLADACQQIVTTDLQNNNRRGLGRHRSINKKQIRQEVGKEVERLELGNLLDKCNSKQVQGRWSKWTNIIRHDVKWRSLINNSNEKLLKFNINASLETLPTRDNLRRWGVKVLGQCRLCGTKENLKHCLSLCSVALHQGRYKWRHNNVLKSISNSINHWYTNAQSNASENSQNSYIAFRGYNMHCKAPPRRSLASNGHLGTPGWSIHMDIKDNQSSIQSVLQSIAPNYSCKQIPDIILHNNTKKCVILAELTCPWEENIFQADSRKRSKYTPLASYLVNAGFNVSFFTFSIGARGYVGKGFDIFLSSLGMPLSIRKRTISKVAHVSNFCSYIIFSRKDNEKWVDFSKSETQAGLV